MFYLLLILNIYPPFKTYSVWMCVYVLRGMWVYSFQQKPYHVVQTISLMLFKMVPGKLIYPNKTLHEKCPNTEFLMVRIFPYLDWIWRFTACVNLRIQSKYRKIRTRKNSVFGHFSRSVKLTELWFSFYCSEGYFCLRHMNQLLVFNPFLASDFLSSSLKYQKDLGFLMIKR